MTVDVLILMASIMFTMLCVGGVVLWILRREYLPVIRRLEQEGRAQAAVLRDAARQTGVEAGE